MREVIIKAWCDACLDDGTRTGAEQIEIMWNGAKYSLDMCDDHLRPYVELDGLINTFGHRTTRRHKAGPEGGEPRAEFPCPECGRAFGTRQGVASHHHQAHTARIPLQCDMCDRTFVNMQGLGAHRRHGHDRRDGPTSMSA